MDILSKKSHRGLNKYCTPRKKALLYCAMQGKEKPYNFLGMADEVISQAPDYVQAYWNEHGFILSHFGAVKWPIINQMRSLMAHGAGASGFSKSLMEMYRNTYMNRRKMWHAFSDCRYHDPGALSTRMQ